ncbi:DsbA family protein [Leptolyngbya sp. 7M]|uniref:DsbA family protein n=1 Tax=Leptolyngbya sp. 7M TaxID=2812896 RepID=UPI001B8D5717|nr:thioredoxin domain-containing protein [Leptolyngbya sp. 7M]QYO66344.1 DsbA family protein [Leptolyngbya sp. 7M]
MKKQEKKSNSATPFIIMGGVLAVVIGAIAYGTGMFGSGSKNTTITPANSSAANAAANRAAQAAANAPLGAPLGVNMIGNASAAVTVEEFADFQCGGCAASHPVLKELQAAYAGNRNFRFIFRHFPLSIPAHDKAYSAALATEAAGLQGKFWQMQDILFRNQAEWSGAPNFSELWEGYARSIGMDVERFKADMKSSALSSRVDADMMRGRGLGVTSTPTILVNGQMVPANITALRAAVDAAMQQVSQASSQATANTGASSNSAK